MELAFAALHQLCAPLLDRLTASRRRSGPRSRRSFGMTAGPHLIGSWSGWPCLSLLSEASEERPLLCVVDDAQWLDRASAQILGFVARRLLAESVVLLFGAREPGQELLGLPELEVAGLRDADARRPAGLGHPRPARPTHPRPDRGRDRGQSARPARASARADA